MWRHHVMLRDRLRSSLNQRRTTFHTRTKQVKLEFCITSLIIQLNAHLLGKLKIKFLYENSRNRKFHDAVMCICDKPIDIKLFFLRCIDLSIPNKIFVSAGTGPTVCYKPGPASSPAHPTRSNGIPGTDSHTPHHSEWPPKPTHDIADKPSQHPTPQTKMDFW
jgi:hypothetical protein